MAPPVHNVQQFEYNGQSVAQVTYLRQGVSVTCAHFLNLDSPNDLFYLGNNDFCFPGNAAQELELTDVMPMLGDSLQVIWHDHGFCNVQDAHVARLCPEDGSFALYVGWSTEDRIKGLSGSLVWDGSRARGIATGVQQNFKNPYVWVQLLDLARLSKEYQNPLK